MAPKQYVSKSPITHIPRRLRKLVESERIRPIYRQCNLCERSFKAVSKFDRFCSNCKNQSLLYRGGE